MFVHIFSFDVIHDIYNVYLKFLYILAKAEHKSTVNKLFFISTGTKFPQTVNILTHFEQPWHYESHESIRQRKKRRFRSNTINNLEMILDGREKMLILGIFCITWDMMYVKIHISSKCGK
jgi:tRNA nucleotidyltransferase/poly(A) polymerase